MTINFKCINKKIINFNKQINNNNNDNNNDNNN